MKRNLNYRYILPFLLGVVLFGLASCANDDFAEEGVSGETIEKKGVLRLEFDLPKYATPANPKHTTRAMSDEAERVIEVDDLSVLVFDAKGLFLYKAPLKKNTFQFDPLKPNKASVVVEIVKTKDKVNFVVVANHTIEASELKKEITTKKAFLENLTYKMPTTTDGNNIWNAKTGASTPFPLYGEKEVLGITEETKSFAIPLFRALARIDIGLDFEIDPQATSGPFSDTAKGLDNFTLKDVRVYRTYEEGYVGKIEASGASVHTDWKRRVDDKPLHYVLASTSDGKALTREIYLPEAEVVDANLSPTEPNNKIHTIVIGGSFDGSGETTYYKLDFAQDIDNDSRLYQSILRNHRYVFNILRVNSPGFSTPERALASASTANIEYEMVHWDTTIHEMHVSGKHYFGLNNEELNFPALIGNYEAEKFTLAYQTNIPLGTHPITFKWATAADLTKRLDASDNFEATLVGGKIVVKPLANNESNKLYEEILYVKAGLIEIPVKLYQDYFVFAYDLDCGSVIVQGTYMVGQQLIADKHYINATIRPDNVNMIGESYNLYVEETNGITFTASGTFESMEPKNIKLQGSGTLQVDNTDPFTVVVWSNSSSGAFCEATVTPILKKINLVSMGLGSTYGYNLTNDRPSNEFVTATANFGPNDDSRVKTEGFNLINGKNSFENAETQKWLTGKGNGGVIADVIHFGFSTSLSKDNAEQIKVYLENGGVLLALVDGKSDAYILLKALFPTDNIVARDGGSSQELFPFAGHPLLKPSSVSDQDWMTHLEELKENEILNGPFGDITEKLWGEDALTPVYIEGLPKDKGIKVFTSMENIGESGSLQTSLDYKNKYVTSFVCESDTYNFFYHGDGGLTSQSGENTSHNICPFTIDSSTMFPIAKIFGHAKLPVYNSAYFGNVLAWAVKKANSPEMMDKKMAYKEQYLQTHPEER